MLRVFICTNRNTSLLDKCKGALNTDRYYLGENSGRVCKSADYHKIRGVDALIVCPLEGPVMPYNPFLYNLV